MVKKKKDTESANTLEDVEEAKTEKAKETVRIEIGTTKKAFLGIIDIVNCLVDEVAIHFSKTGARIQTVDPAHVSMIGMDIPKKYFTAYEYKSKEHEEYKIGVDIGKIKKFLRTLDQADELEIEYSDVTKTLVFKAGRVRRKMAEIDTTGMSEPKVPDLNLPTTIKMSNEQLSQAIKAVEQVSDHIKFSTKGDTLNVFGEGDTDQVDISFGPDDKVEIKAKDDISSMFPLDYLSVFSKAIASKSNLVLNMGNDYPVKIFFIIENNGADIEAKYLLAPRIDADA
jgi:proliferating cell nuclear antigen